MQFLNPWGLLALIGIPAVLLIHALRRSPKTFLTNTLFLIEAKLRDPGGGRRLRRLRRSAQLWLRLLLVTLIAWVLIRPVSVREDSVQRLVLVIDTSASMSAAKEALIPALEATLKPWMKQTAHVELIALNSLADAAPIHRGWDDFDAMIDQVEESQFSSGNHDPLPALNLALGLAATHGRVLFVTDHVIDPMPAGIGLLAIGSPLQNVGWCGVDASPDGSWKAILRNYGDSVQQRTLTQADGSLLEISLKPGEWRNFEGILPEGASQATLRLTPDAFALDDDLFLIRQHRKPLTWTSVALPKSLDRLLTASGASAATDAASADIEIRQNDLAPAVVDHARLLLPSAPGEDAPYVETPATATIHELTDGLIFDGLLWRQCAPLNPAAPEDTVLLWAGDAPMAILRNSNTTLELGFHPDLSNFSRVPSALVMIQRWIDSIRDAKVAPESLQLATNDQFRLASDAEGEKITFTSKTESKSMPPSKLLIINAPTTAGFIAIAQGDKSLLEAAVNFVDPIESDFGKADADLISPTEPKRLVQEATMPDRFRDLWLLLALAVLLLTWTFPETSNTRPQPT